MTKIPGLGFPRFFLCIIACFFLQLIPGLADDATISDPSTNANAPSKKSSGSSNHLEMLIIILGVVAVSAFSFFLYKLWQRKKREEQHARLLKLFEQDDELEVELGIRD